MSLIYNKKRARKFQEAGKFGLDTFDPEAAGKAKAERATFYPEPITPTVGINTKELDKNASDAIKQGQVVKDINGGVAGGKLGDVKKVTTKEEKITEIPETDVAVDSDKAGKPGMSASTSGMIGMAAGAAAEIGKGMVDDGDDETFTDGEYAAEIGGAMAEGAAAGAAFGPWGMAAGAAIGGVKGWIAADAAKGAAIALGITRSRGRETERAQAEIGEVQRRNGGLKVAASMMYGDQMGGATGYARKGMKFNADSFADFKLEAGGDFDGKIVKKVLASPLKKFKKGGKIKETENIIPNGVLHEENNKLGDKGMPVVKCSLKNKSCDKKYEIEKDEMILTKTTTEKIEELAKGGKLEELGEFMASQIVDNTHSFTGKYEHLNGPTNESLFN